MRSGSPSHWRERRAARFAALEHAGENRSAEAPLHVDIERLVLRGVSRRDAGAIAQALQAELVRLVEQRPSAPPGVARVNAGKITPAAAPERTGRAIGVAVHKALWR
jgi:hypothetical protein